MPKVDVPRDVTKDIQEDYILLQNTYKDKEVISVVCVNRGEVIGWNLMERK